MAMRVQWGQSSTASGNKVHLCYSRPIANHVKTFDVVDDIHILEDLQPIEKPTLKPAAMNWKTGREPEEKDLWVWPRVCGSHFVVSMFFSPGGAVSV